jgi:hypothetical protein
VLLYNTRMEMNAVAEYMRQLSTIEPLTKHKETTLFEQLSGTNVNAHRAKKTVKKFHNA